MNEFLISKIPRELWMCIFGYLKLPRRLTISTVNSLWRSLVYESVTTLDTGSEGEWLTDHYVLQFPALKTLQLHRNSMLTDRGLALLRTLTTLTLRYSFSAHITDHGIKGL